MPSAYATPPSPAEVSPSSTDCDRIAGLLAEIATIPALFDHGPAFTFVSVSSYGTCDACWMDGQSIDADAILCRDPHLVHREHVCTRHLADVVRYEQGVHAPAVMWVEIPLTFAPPTPAWKAAYEPCGCWRDPSLSCPRCDGTAADEARGYVA